MHCSVVSKNQALTWDANAGYPTRHVSVQVVSKDDLLRLRHRKGDYGFDRLADGPCCSYGVFRRPIQWIAFGYCLRLAFAARDGRPGMASFLCIETDSTPSLFSVSMGRRESRLANGRCCGLEDGQIALRLLGIVRLTKYSSRHRRAKRDDQERKPASIHPRRNRRVPICWIRRGSGSDDRGLRSSR